MIPVRVQKALSLKNRKKVWSGEGVLNGDLHAASREINFITTALIEIKK